VSFGPVVVRFTRVVCVPCGHSSAVVRVLCPYVTLQSTRCRADAPRALPVHICCSYTGYIFVNGKLAMLHCGTGTPCSKDSSSLGARRRQDAINTMQRGCQDVHDIALRLQHRRRAIVGKHKKQNRQYITYYIAARGGPSHDRRQRAENLVKFDVWFPRYARM